MAAVDEHPRKFAVGLTGGIGSGKSTVARQFAALGATLIDTDAIAHALSAPHGAAMPALLAEFGPDYATPEGALDRVRMRALVFSDPGAKARLEAIVHPLISQAALAAAAVASGPYLIYEVPLLVESGVWRARVDRVLVVDCPEAVQVARVMARNGMSESQVLAIMASQVSRAERLAAADDIVNNGGPEADLSAQVSRLHQNYLILAERLSRLPRERL